MCFVCFASIKSLSADTQQDLICGHIHLPFLYLMIRTNLVNWRSHFNLSATIDIHRRWILIVVLLLAVSCKDRRYAGNIQIKTTRSTFRCFFFFWSEPVVNLHQIFNSIPGCGSSVCSNTAEALARGGMGVQTDHSTMLKSSLLWDILLQFLWSARQARSHGGRSSHELVASSFLGFEK